VDVGRTWSICRDQAERDRFLDMHVRMLPAQRRVLAVVAALLLPTVPWVDPWALVPLGFVVVVYTLVQHLAMRFGRPEVLIAGGLLVAQALIAAAIVINDGQHAAGLAILTWPVVAAGGRFPTRVVRFFTAYTAMLMVIASLGFDGSAVLHQPPLLAMPLATLLAVTMFSTVVRESDITHRSAAIRDELTGMLNRTALVNRSAEIEYQSRLTGEPVALILGDIDDFKAVNDHHGHAAGDAVLRDVADVLRRELRAFDLAYRLGGEEFAVLIPGADAPRAAELAERLRAAVRARPVGDLAVTMSFGVAASARDVAFVWDDAFAAADRALYAAKAAGRDCVRAAGATAELPAAAA
jgi:diguanylate cyclase (GGDEF)-like protein